MVSHNDNYVEFSVERQHCFSAGRFLMISSLMQKAELAFQVVTATESAANFSEESGCFFSCLEAAKVLGKFIGYRQAIKERNIVVRMKRK